jgi:hypothetical protein
MTGHPHARRPSRIARMSRPVRALAAAALGLTLAAFVTAPRARAHEPGRKRPPTHRAGLARAARATVTQGTGHMTCARLPGLTDPALRGSSKRAFRPALSGPLRFDAQGAWWALASLLEVLPVLPRLDGTLQRSVGLAVNARALVATLPQPAAARASVFGDATRGNDAKALEGPDAGMRRLGSRLLRTLGLGSIAGEAVFVLEGAVAGDDTEALPLAALPPRPWEWPDPADATDTPATAVRSPGGRRAMGVTTRVTRRSAALRLVGTF